MAIIEVFPNHQIKSGETVNKTDNGFELILLAMMTVFDIELTVNQINLNLSRLFVELKLPIQKNLTMKVRTCLSSLDSKGLILRRSSSYVISEKGKPLGFQALLRFRQNTESFKN